MAESYFQVGTQESLGKICRCLKHAAERKDYTDYCWSCFNSRELPPYIWYAIQAGAKFQAEVHDVKPKLFPLEEVD